MPGMCVTLTMGSQCASVQNFGSWFDALVIQLALSRQDVNMRMAFCHAGVLRSTVFYFS